MDRTEQTERIRAMEARMRRGEKVLAELRKALDAYEEAREDFRTLAGYIEDGTWMRDFLDDEEGKLPPYDELPRGVLSEDGLDDLLNARMETIERMRKMTADELEEIV